MENIALRKSRTKVAVVGVGYWGKNLVRNFNELGALASSVIRTNPSKSTASLSTMA